MRSTYILLFLGVLNIQAHEIIHIQSFDGEIIEGRLNIPTDNFKNKIVIDVPSTGPFTYETNRKIGSLEFTYHDYFLNEFADRGIAYFSYSTRYTVPDSIPPYFDNVDKEKFYSYTPTIKVKDLEEIIKYLRNDKRLATCRFILLGWSEGSIIASLVADRELVPVDALFLAGTPSDDVYSTILWQHSGESSMINLRKFFDNNKDGIIQRVEYDNGDPRAIARMGGATFEQLDMNQDSVLTAEDFSIMLVPRLQQIIFAIENNDNDWIWNNFFRVGAAWINDHRVLEPNKTRLLRLELPVFIFHGTNDANTPVEGILQLQKAARKIQKSNLHFYIIPESDHSLDFLHWVINNTMPTGIMKLIEQIEKL